MEKEQNPSRLQVQWHSRCWPPRRNSQEASSIRHFLLDQVLWDTLHLQADLGHPATSQSVQPSRWMEREPRHLPLSPGQSWDLALASGWIITHNRNLESKRNGQNPT